MKRERVNETLISKPNIIARCKSIMDINETRHGRGKMRLQNNVSSPLLIYYLKGDMDGGVLSIGHRGLMTGSFEAVLPNHFLPTPTLHSPT
jgi:hypothetical protein